MMVMAIGAPNAPQALVTRVVKRLRTSRTLTPAFFAFNGFSALAAAGMLISLVVAAVELRSSSVAPIGLGLGYFFMAGLVGSAVLATIDEGRERTGWWWSPDERRKDDAAPKDPQG